MGLTTVLGLALAGLQWWIAPILFAAAMGDGAGLVLVLLYTVLGVVSGLLHLAAGITFIVWMFRSRGVQVEARQNAPVTEPSASPAPAA